MADEEKKPEQAEGEANTETSSEPKAEAKTEPKAEPEGERRFTQDEVNETVEKRLAKERRRLERELRKEYEAQKKPQPKAENPKQEPTNEETRESKSEDDGSADRIAAIEQKLAKAEADSAFNETLVDAGLNPTKAQRKILRKLFDPEEPEDIVDHAKELGIGAEQKKQETAEAKQEKQGQGENPGPAHIYEDPGAPRTIENFEQVDARKWSRADIDRMRADGTFLERLEKFRASLPGGANGLFKKKVPKVS